MTVPHINRIGTAVPQHDIHAAFAPFARSLLADERSRTLFDRMAERSGIEHRFSVLQAGEAGADQVDVEGFLHRGAFPATGARMARYEQHATPLAIEAVAALGVDPGSFTHIVVASCTGFTAPGLDQVLAARLGMRPDIERTLVGFMGCYAAVSALRCAFHTVRSDPAARVLVVNLELCTLHVQETPDLETALSFMLFGDGASAALVSAAPDGFAMLDFRSIALPDSADLITWRIGDGRVRHAAVRQGARPHRHRPARRVGAAGCGRAAARAGDAAGRPVGRACRRPHRAGRGGAGPAPRPRRAGLVARRAAGFRQHVVGHDHVHPGPHAAWHGRAADRDGHGVRAWPVRRNVPVPARMNLAVRSDAPELMDTDCTDAADYAACLRDLARVNTVTLARRPTLAWLDRAMRRRARRTAISVFDVAYGEGDMLRAVARWARRRHRPVRLGGVDLNPAAAAAAQAASPGLALELQTGDVLAAVPVPAPDYIVSSLFTHHLTDAQAVAFLQWMERHAGHGWFVNDLHRHAVPLAGFRLLSRALRWHRFVQHDGAVSIARAFRRADWQRLLAEAGVPGEVRWVFPFRLCVSRLR